MEEKWIKSNVPAEILRKIEQLLAPLRLLKGGVTTLIQPIPDQSDLSYVEISTKGLNETERDNLLNNLNSLFPPPKEEEKTKVQKKENTEEEPSLATVVRNGP
ncbi:MAG: hypothetical protein PHD51_01680 [Patescibacteria group bacterium]|nr:hypothetical protein [Patescibacteria group bacterium]MDD5490427.1 hypothetical protein [Patescibacteria group bacterium]